MTKIISTDEALYGKERDGGGRLAGNRSGRSEGDAHFIKPVISIHDGVAVFADCGFGSSGTTAGAMVFSGGRDSRSSPAESTLATS